MASTHVDVRVAAGSRSGDVAYQDSTSRSRRFQRSRGSTRLPTFGRELSRLFPISILMASRTAERLAAKVSAHVVSLGRTVPGG